MRAGWKNFLQNLVARILLCLFLYISLAQSTQHDCDRVAKRIACAKISGILPITYNTDILLQEGAIDSLQSSTPQWKTTGRYGVQFMGATALTTGCLFISVAASVQEDWNSSTIAKTYIFTNSLITGPGTWMIGKAFGHEGSIYKSAIGAGIGSAVGILPIVRDVSEDDSKVLIWLALLVPPALGAVIGANL